MATFEKVDNEITFVKKIENLDSLETRVTQIEVQNAKKESLSNGDGLAGIDSLTGNSDSENVKENGILDEESVLKEGDEVIKNEPKKELDGENGKSENSDDDVVFSKMEVSPTNNRTTSGVVSPPKPAKKTILDYLAKASQLFKKKGPADTDLKKEHNSSKEGLENNLERTETNTKSDTLVNNNNNNDDKASNDVKNVTLVSSKPKVPRARKSANPNKASDINIEATVKSIHLGPLANVTLHVPEIGKVLGANRLQKLGLTRSTPPKEVESLQRENQEENVPEGGGELSKSEPTKTEISEKVPNLEENVGRARIGGGDMPRGKKRKTKPFRGGRYHLGIRPKAKHTKKDSPSKTGRPGRKKPGRKPRATNTNETSSTATAISETVTKSDDQSSSNEISVQNISDEKYCDTSENFTEIRTKKLNVDSKDSENNSEPCLDTKEEGMDSVGLIRKGHEAENNDSLVKEVADNHAEEDKMVVEEQSLVEEPGGVTLTDNDTKAVNLIKKVRRRRNSWSKGCIVRPKNKKKMSLEARVAKLKNHSHNIIRHKIQLAAIESQPQNRVSENHSHSIIQHKVQLAAIDSQPQNQVS